MERCGKKKGVKEKKYHINIFHGCREGTVYGKRGYFFWGSAKPVGVIQHLRNGRQSGLSQRGE